MYTTYNFTTKKALREAVTSGKRVTIFQPGPFRGNEPLNGRVALEGPHYPKPHRWYASATITDGQVTEVR